MWLLVALLALVGFWWWRTQRVEPMTVTDILGDIQRTRPELYPINTISMEPDGRSRFMMYNLDTYAGELYDYFPPKK